MTSVTEAARLAAIRSDSDVHYHIIGGMGGGYLPSWDSMADSLDEAVQIVRDEISRDTDFGPDDVARMFSDVAFDYEEGYAYASGYYPEDVSPHDLGWYYEATRHADSDPYHEDCRAILNGEKEYPLV